MAVSQIFNSDNGMNSVSVEKVLTIIFHINKKKIKVQQWRNYFHQLLSILWRQRHVEVSNSWFFAFAIRVFPLLYNMLMRSLLKLPQCLKFNFNDNLSRHPLLIVWDADDLNCGRKGCHITAVIYEILS